MVLMMNFISVPSVSALFEWLTILRNPGTSDPPIVLQLRVLYLFHAVNVHAPHCNTNRIFKRQCASFRVTVMRVIATRIKAASKTRTLFPD
jgi:hypothetical protein